MNAQALDALAAVREAAAQEASRGLQAARSELERAEACCAVSQGQLAEAEAMLLQQRILHARPLASVLRLRAADAMLRAATLARDECMRRVAATEQRRSRAREQVEACRQVSLDAEVQRRGLERMREARAELSRRRSERRAEDDAEDVLRARG